MTERVRDLATVGALLACAVTIVAAIAAGGPAVPLAGLAFGVLAVAAAVASLLTRRRATSAGPAWRSGWWADWVRAAMVAATVLLAAIWTVNNPIGGLVYCGTVDGITICTVSPTQSALALMLAVGGTWIGVWVVFAGLSRVAVHGWRLWAGAVPLAMAGIGVFGYGLLVGAYALEGFGIREVGGTTGPIFLLALMSVFAVIEVWVFLAAVTRPRGGN